MASFIELGGMRYRLCEERATSIAIPLIFDGPQPNHFGVPNATATVVAGEGFVGDTRRGGSCNVATLQLTPHCNGTHTESIAHIVHQSVPVGELALPLLQSCLLLSVEPVDLGRSDEEYWPNPQPADRVVTRRALLEALDAVEFPEQLGDCSALVIRTLPNELEKRQRVYDDDRPPVFLTTDAMALVSEYFDHLLVDFPSVDKMYDEGQLSNHRLFWAIARGSAQLDEDAQQRRTITEMVYVPESLQDGHYALNLQVPAFQTDAAPSRPVLVPVEQA
ncbi:cyclase family protein [Biformimicrobium ophioploci]|uniref:Cyclase family protein n=1 Tax=Biformimicrobium ophioploci TaxID=3036711 RepID=A0ABQ6LXG8_9GAMM|nr:cyclase family protein [Microbulbifer sp. NKW57]GMG86792.1 cyclase family protein [Microbulbifer sp. NKW57]